MNSDLAALIQDFADLPDRTHRRMVDTTREAASRAEQQARRNATGHRRLQHYPSSITSEVTSTKTEVRAEVGPEKGGQGSLGHLIEYGSPVTGARLHVNQAVDGETSRWFSQLARTVEL